MFLFRSIPGFCSFIDENGEVIDFVRLVFIHKRRNTFVDGDRIRKVCSKYY